MDARSRKSRTLANPKRTDFPAGCGFECIRWKEGGSGTTGQWEDVTATAGGQEVIRGDSWQRRETSLETEAAWAGAFHSGALAEVTDPPESGIKPWRFLYAVHVTRVVLLGFAHRVYRTGAFS